MPQAELDGEAANADTQITTDKSLYEIKLRNKQVLSKMAVQVMRFDRQLGENVIRGWTTWKKGEEIILPKTTGKVYRDLNEYLPDRFDDIGWPYATSPWPHNGPLLIKRILGWSSTYYTGELEWCWTNRTQRKSHLF